MKEIEELNKNRTSNHSALHGLTVFSDLTRKEFEEIYLSKELAKRIYERQLTSQESEESNSKEIHKRSVKNIPLKVDWRQNSTISKVKNQKQCGACWAFCVIENVEAMVAMKLNKLEEYSIQELIDCAGYGNEGCNGGDMCTLLKWMTERKVKIVKETEYPLKLKNNECKIKKNQTGIEIVAYSCEKQVNESKFITTN